MNHNTTTHEVTVFPTGTYVSGIGGRCGHKPTLEDYDTHGANDVDLATLWSQRQGLVTTDPCPAMRGY